MSIGTKLYTWLYGKMVGTDEIGNKYYTNSSNCSCNCNCTRNYDCNRNCD